MRSEPRYYRIGIPVFILVLALSWSALGQVAPRDFTLPLMLVPSEGSVASYLVTESMQQKLNERTGFFLFAPTDDMEDSDTWAAGVRYTVLESRPEEGTARVRVEAQALDPETYTPIGSGYWEATYWLTPDGSEWEGGHVIPDDYESLIDPSWMGRWMLTPVEERPSGALSPGFRWSARPDVSAFGEDFPFDSAQASLVGTFVGWEQLPAGYGQGARVIESFSGQGEVVEDLGDGMPGVMAFNITGASRYGVIPNGFPYGAELSLTGDMTLSVAVTADVPFALEGGVTVGINFRQSFRRDDAGPDQWFTARAEGLASSDGSIEIGQTIRGTLSKDSPTFGDGTAFDLYTFHGIQGQSIAIRAESDAFDTYLLLYDVADELLAQNDDAGYTSNSLIQLTLPYTGTYTLLVNSYWEDEYGEYTLSIQPIHGPVVDIELATDLIWQLTDPGSLSKAELAEIEEVLWLLLELVESYRD